MDVSASEFGSCKCGFKKAEHGKRRDNFLKKNPGAPVPPPRASDLSKLSIATPAAAAPPPPAPVSRAKPVVNQGPCRSYTVDLTGKFGHCKCGFSREDHKHAGTLVEKEHAVFAGGHVADPNRATSAPRNVPRQKQVKPCADYQVDTNGAQYGDCTCSHPRVKHRQFGMVHDVEEPEPIPEPEPVAEVIVRDGTQPCVKFELDVKNLGGYGACLCGFSRLDHEQFSINPSEWMSVKDSLTAPKDFS